MVNTAWEGKPLIVARAGTPMVQVTAIEKLSMKPNPAQRGQAS